MIKKETDGGIQTLKFAVVVDSELYKMIETLNFTKQLTVSFPLSAVKLSESFQALIMPKIQPTTVAEQNII